MTAYARGLQYWVEKLNPLRSPDLHPLAGSVVELRETVQEYVTFDHWDVVQGLGVIHLGSTSWWPQTTLFSHMLSLLVNGQDFMQTTTHTVSPIAEEDVTRCTTPLSETERESWYLLVVTAYVGQLNWDLATITTKDPQLIHMMKTHSGTHGWLPHSLDVLGQSVMEAPL